MCGRRTENEDHPVRIMFGVHSFCSCFVGESAGYVWQFKIEFVWCSNRIVLLIMHPLILWRVGVTLLSDCILFLTVCTESDGKLNRGLATRLLFLYRMILRKSLIDIAACVCVCVYAHVYRVSVHVWEGSHHSLPCMWSWMKLLHLSESLEVPLVSFLVSAMCASLSSI